MAVECFQYIHLNLVFQSFGVHVRFGGFRLFSTVFARRLTPLYWVRSTLLSLMLTRETSARKSLTFASFLYDETLPSLSWLVLVIDNHLFELVKLECFHKDFLLLLELKLLLRI